MHLLNVFFPKIKIEYHTSFTQNEIVRLLSAHTEPNRNLRRADILIEHKKFEGTIEQDRLEISNVPDKNSYHVCHISGEIHATGTGTHVILSMGSPKSYAYAYIFFFVLLVVVLATFPFSKVQHTQVFPVYISIIFGVVFVLAFPFFIAKRVKKVMGETCTFFDNLFNCANHRIS